MCSSQWNRVGFTNRRNQRHPLCAIAVQTACQPQGAQQRVLNAGGPTSVRLSASRRQRSMRFAPRLVAKLGAALGRRPSRPDAQPGSAPNALGPTERRAAHPRAGSPQLKCHARRDVAKFGGEAPKMPREGAAPLRGRSEQLVGLHPWVGSGRCTRRPSRHMLGSAQRRTRCRHRC